MLNICPAVRSAILPSIHKRLRTLCTFALALWVTTSIDASCGPESVKVLTIGNSFADDALAFMEAFAFAGGKSWHVLRANIGGASLARHIQALEAHAADPNDSAGRPYRGKIDPQNESVRDFSLMEALQADDWDYVTLQQFSNFSFIPESYEPAAGKLIKLIRQELPRAEIVLHQTWAYHDAYSGFEDPDFDSTVMHRKIADAYRALANHYQLRIIPTGEAFYQARTLHGWHNSIDPIFNFECPTPYQLPDQSDSLIKGWTWHPPGDDAKLVLDYKHASPSGQYLAGAVWYAFFFEEPAPAIHMPETLSAEQALLLRTTAWEVTREAQFEAR